MAMESPSALGSTEATTSPDSVESTAITRAEERNDVGTGESRAPPPRHRGGDDLLATFMSENATCLRTNAGHEPSDHRCLNNPSTTVSQHRRVSSIGTRKLNGKTVSRPKGRGTSKCTGGERPTLTAKRASGFVTFAGRPVAPHDLLPWQLCRKILRGAAPDTALQVQR